ncbi:MAG: hypothetical protein PUF48_06720 [Oscillospiraceae bacterium]|nr:hypothetical protein [Oscillospiraceae bacterium]
MKDCNNFKSWKSNHSSFMRDLTFAKPDDIFIYTSFKMSTPFEVGEHQVLFAENVEEAARYFRDIFLYDLLVDATDDLELDEALRTEERQQEALFLLNLWFRTGKALHKSDIKKVLSGLIKEFNQQFNNQNELQYEFQILCGANALKQFLKSKFKDKENFDEKKLENICSNQLFAGKLLSDFIEGLKD